MNKPDTPTTPVTDAVTQAAVQAIVETVEKKETPCSSNDQACNRRWIESISDCC
jgi:hypothetical protein